MPAPCIRARGCGDLGICRMSIWDVHLILRPRERGAKNNNQLPLRSSAASGRVCAGRSSHQHLTLPSSIPLLCNLGLCMREGSKASSYFFKGFSKGGLCCEFSPTLPISCCPGLLKDAPVLHLKPHLPFAEELTKVPSVSVKRWQYYRKKAVKSIPVNKGGDHLFRAASAFPSSDELSSCSRSARLLVATATALAMYFCTSGHHL